MCDDSYHTHLHTHSMMSVSVLVCVASWTYTAPPLAHSVSVQRPPSICALFPFRVHFQSDLPETVAATRRSWIIKKKELHFADARYF